MPAPFWLYLTAWLYYPESLAQAFGRHSRTVTSHIDREPVSQQGTDIEPLPTLPKVPEC